MLGQTNSFDATTAGIKFTSPGITFTAKNMAINGGLNFDLPLAAVTMSQNNALSFFRMNTNTVGGGIIKAATLGSNGLDMTINATGARVLPLSYQALSNVAGINSHAISAAQDIFHGGAGVQRYAAKKNSGWCFITTAVCEAEGKPDDCAELQTLRKWRDEVLRKMPGGDALVRVYYKVAPAALETIKKSKRAQEILNVMRDVYIADALAFIARGDNQSALHTYCELVDFALTAAEDCENG